MSEMVLPVGDTPPPNYKEWEPPPMSAENSCIPDKSLWGGSVDVDIHKVPTIEQRTAAHIAGKFARG